MVMPCGRQFEKFMNFFFFHIFVSEVFFVLMVLNS
jgi:hypothetical protein